MSYYVIVRLIVFILLLGAFCIVNKKRMNKSIMRIVLMAVSVLLVLTVINAIAGAFYWNMLPLMLLIALGRNIPIEDKRIFYKMLIRMGLMLVLLIAIPFENVIFSFGKPEDAFYYREKSLYSHQIDGNESVLFITNTVQNEAYLSVKTKYTILNKKNNKWLVDHKIPNRYKVSFYDDFSIITLQNVFSNEKYILVSSDVSSNPENLEIVSEIPMDVILIVDQYGQRKENTYCIIIDKSRDFYFSINDEEIIINS